MSSCLNYPSLFSVSFKLEKLKIFEKFLNSTQVRVEKPVSKYGICTHYTNALTVSGPCDGEECTRNVYIAFKDGQPPVLAKLSIRADAA